MSAKYTPFMKMMVSSNVCGKCFPRRLFVQSNSSSSSDRVVQPFLMQIQVLPAVAASFQHPDTLWNQKKHCPWRCQCLILHKLSCASEFHTLGCTCSVLGGNFPLFFFLTQKKSCKKLAPWVVARKVVLFARYTHSTLVHNMQCPAMFSAGWHQV